MKVFRGTTERCNDRQDEERVDHQGDDLCGGIPDVEESQRQIARRRNHEGGAHESDDGIGCDHLIGTTKQHLDLTHVNLRTPHLPPAKLLGTGSCGFFRLRRMYVERERSANKRDLILCENMISYFFSIVNP